MCKNIYIYIFEAKWDGVTGELGKRKVKSSFYHLSHLYIYSTRDNPLANGSMPCVNSQDPLVVTACFQSSRAPTWAIYKFSQSPPYKTMTVTTVQGFLPWSLMFIIFLSRKKEIKERKRKFTLSLMRFPFLSLSLVFVFWIVLLAINGRAEVLGS